MKKIYVGLHADSAGSTREAFRSVAEPTRETHGKLWNAIIGPFRTMRGAKAAVHYGDGNPHMQHVRDAERIGKQYADDLKGKPYRRFTAV